MKKYLFSLALAAVSLSASADELLSKMSARIKALGDYEVSFTISAGAFRASGRYAVSGNAYFLTLGDTDVYCDGTTRREVNRAAKEVAVDRVDPSERNILNNPVGGLQFLDEEYSSQRLSSAEGTTTLRLRSRAGDDTTVDVTVDTAAQLPRKLVYRLGSDEVTVELSDIRRSSEPLPVFDAKAFPDYEIIDFR